MDRIAIRPLHILLLLFLTLGAVYSVVTPIFEAGDEVWHYPFVQWLASGHGLPVQDPAHKQLWEQEGGQPPLYYALAAAASGWINTRDLPERVWRNPYARIGVPLAYGDKNLVVHTSAEDFPWRGTTLAVHLLRLLSLLLGAGTVTLTYWLAREMLPDSNANSTLPLAAAALVAFNPMFLFISASVNNDNLATVTAALALWLMVRLATRGPTDQRLLGLGGIIGLAALSKVSDLALLPLAGLVVLWLAWRRRDAGLLLRGSLWLGGPALALAGWWYARNYVLYGDPLGLNVWLQVAGGRPPVTLLGLLPEFQGFRISFWGNFGGVNLIGPEWVYTVLDLFSLLALAGLILGAVKRWLPGALAIPALWLVFVFGALVRWTLLTYASQGRLIFPAVTAGAVLLTFGLEQLRLALSSFRFTPYLSRLPSPVSRLVPYALPSFLFAFALAAPFLIIAPAYQLPPRRNTSADAPNPVHIVYEAKGQPELVGYELGRAARPGEELPVTLYWRAAAPVEDDLAVYIHLYDEQGKLIGQWDALPGNGLYPARLWKPGELIEDRYRVPVAWNAQAPQIGRVEAGLARSGSPVPLRALDPEGQEIVSSLGRFKVAGGAAPASAQPPLYRIGDEFELTRFEVQGRRGITEFQVTPPREGALLTPLQPGDMLAVNLALRATRVPAHDYTMFVHLVSPQGQVSAQQDNPPRLGAYPTSFWDAGEEVVDQFILQVPADALAGDYQIEFGVYRAEAGRLPVNGAPHGGLSAAGDHLLLAPLPLQAP